MKPQFELGELVILSWEERVYSAKVVEIEWDDNEWYYRVEPLDPSPPKDLTYYCDAIHKLYLP